MSGRLNRPVNAPDDGTPAIAWYPERDDRRLRRVTEILLGILSNPVDSQTTPGDGGRR